MSCSETCFLILITLIFTNLTIQSLASSRQITPTDFIQSFKDSYRKNVQNYNEIYGNNEREQDQCDNPKKLSNKVDAKYLKRSIREDLNNEYERKRNNIQNQFTLLGEEEIFDIKDENSDDKIIDIEKKYLNDMDFNNQHDFFHNYNNYEDNENLDYDYEMLNIITPKIMNCNDMINRREVSTNAISNINLQNSSLYPSVLTKALEISLNPSTASHTTGSLLGNVAQQLNTSSLDLAKELTKSETLQNNDQFSEIVQSYLTKNNAMPTFSNTELNQPLTQTKETLLVNPPNSFKQNSINNKDYAKNEESFDGITTSKLTEILDRVLNKLDSIHDAKNNDYDDHPDGAPCDIIGSWSSSTLGLCFNIEFGKDKLRDISPAEINNKLLTISVVDCTPPKHHQIIDLDWKFTGSALKQFGGLFYLYGQKRSESVAATFLGFCRTCGGIDTIFGSWNFLFPSKDCNDISLAFEVKRDVLRRLRMEMKRKERFKELLYESRHVKI